MAKVTADFETLMQQAPMTANLYLLAGLRNLEERMGHRYTVEHPEVISAFLLTCALDLFASAVANGLQEVADALRERHVE